MRIHLFARFAVLLALLVADCRLAGAELPAVVSTADLQQAVLTLLDSPDLAALQAQARHDQGFEATLATITRPFLHLEDGFPAQRLQGELRDYAALFTAVDLELPLLLQRALDEQQGERLDRAGLIIGVRLCRLIAADIGEALDVDIEEVDIGDVRTRRLPEQGNDRNYGGNSEIEWQ